LLPEDEPAAAGVLELLELLELTAEPEELPLELELELELEPQADSAAAATIAAIRTPGRQRIGFSRTASRRALAKGRNESTRISLSPARCRCRSPTALAGTVYDRPQKSTLYLVESLLRGRPVRNALATTVIVLLRLYTKSVSARSATAASVTI
jgi:hypothetical protein